MSDYYRVLGVQKDAGAEEIKRAYRRLAKKYHPDSTGGDKSAEKKFIEINEAYDTLSDPKKRKEYDAQRDNPFAGRAGRYTYTESPFGGAGTFGGAPFSGFGGGTRYEYQGLDMDDILGDLFGGRVQTKQRLDVQAQCDVTPWMAALGGRIEVRVSDKTLSVKIPPGSQSGQKLRLRGQGLADGKGNTGDLVIELTIQNPKALTPEMKRLYEKLSEIG